MPQPLVGDLDVAVSQKCSIAKSAAETLLRLFNMNGGGAHIYVRVPLAFANPGDAAQLGLAGAGSEDVLLEPVVVLAKPNDPKKKELLISAGAVERALAQVSFANLSTQVSFANVSTQVSFANLGHQLFESAIGVVVGGELLRVVSIGHEEVGGEAFLYRVTCSL